MQRDLNQNIEREKKLARRSWQGLALLLIIGSAMMIGMTGLIWLLPQLAKRAEDPARMLPVVLLGLALSLVIGIGGLAVLIYVIRWSTKPDRARFERSTRVLEETLPGLAGERETKAAGQVFSGKIPGQLLVFILLYLLVVGLFMIGLKKGLEQVWPGAPDWVSDVILFLVIFVGGALVGRVLDKRRAQKGEGKGCPSNQMASQTVGSLFYFAFLIVPLIGLLMLITQLPVHPLLVPVLGLVLCTLAAGVLFFVYMLIPHFWIMAAVKRADYGNALSRVEIIEKFHLLRGEFLNTHGVILFWAGRYAEAEELLQESIRAQRQEAMGAGSAALENIGCALRAQGKYGAAIKAFEGSIRIAPTQAPAYTDLAQVYLEQGIEPQRALELTDRALQNYQASFEARRLDSHTPGAIWGNRAWAFALLGRDQNVEQALARAWAATPRDFKPARAGVHYRAGRARLAQGDRARATEQFAAAQQLDPNGHYGQTAARAQRDL